MGSTPFEHSVLKVKSVLNVKAVVAAFNQEKALVGAFSVIVQLHRLIVNGSTAKQLDRGSQAVAVSWGGKTSQQFTVPSFLTADCHCLQTSHEISTNFLSKGELN